MKNTKRISLLMTFALSAGICRCALAADKKEDGKEGKEYSFVQVSETPSTHGFVDAETDAFEVNTTKEEDGIASKIYRPASGNALVVEFHGTGEGEQKRDPVTILRLPPTDRLQKEYPF